MTTFMAMQLLPANRILALEAQKLASFYHSEASAFSRICDKFMAQLENRLIEKMLMKRLKRVFRAGDNAELLQDYLSAMRQDYISGRKETLSVLSQSAASLELLDTPLSGWDTDTLERDTAAPKKPKPILYYVIGGGFVLPPSQREREMVERLAKACDCRPVLGQHRLAPENPFPAGVQDIADHIGEARKAAQTGTPFFVAADTAGASLLMGALQIMRKEGAKMPDGVLLFSPWCDLSLSGWSYVTRSANADSPFRMETAAFCARLYLQSQMATHPLASAIYAELTDFPPMAIHTSEYDMHFDDAITLSENAKNSGIECHLNYWDTPRHHLERLKSKDAQKSYDIAAAFIQRICAHL